jgi:hypothetical protein
MGLTVLPDGYRELIVALNSYEKSCKETLSPPSSNDEGKTAVNQPVKNLNF